LTATVCLSKQWPLSLAGRRYPASPGTVGAWETFYRRYCVLHSEMRCEGSPGLGPRAELLQYFEKCGYDRWGGRRRRRTLN